ncbi:MAG TPA: hypothetical protein VFZ53_02215 [Polyangiaceae bacterium]
MPAGTATFEERKGSRTGGFWRVLWGTGIVYIAAIGVFAIEELKRRDDALALFRAAIHETASAAVASGAADGAKAAKSRRELEKLRELESRLTALIVTGSVRPMNKGDGTLRVLMCEFSALADEKARCDVARGGVRDVFGYVVLKRPAERTASGDIFAVLVVVAAIGGALIRLYLPGTEQTDAFRTIMRAIGGGVVCYLAISGGALTATDMGLTTIESPATASLLGLLAGMFATRVFKLISDVVDNWIKKLAPAKEPAPSKQQP